MTRNDFRESKEFKKGQNGEKIVAAFLKSIGWYIVPSYDYTGHDQDKAPKLHGDYHAYVIPDLDASKEGRRRWVEVKTKEKADWTRITQRFEHGFSKRHYLHYQEVQKITGTPVWLFVYELSTRKILCQSLDVLSETKREYLGSKMDKGGTVFFPRDSFFILTEIKENAATSLPD